MNQSDVFSLLSAPGPYPEYAEKMMLYGQYIGSRDIKAAWHLPDGTLRKGRGEWHFAWILGGRAVQDVLFAVGASPDRLKEDLRVLRELGGLGRGSDPARLERWSFAEITPDSFLWLGEVSLDEGATWTLEQEMRARRRNIVSQKEQI